MCVWSHDSTTYKLARRSPIRTCVSLTTVSSYQLLVERLLFTLASLYDADLHAMMMMGDLCR